MIKFETPHYLYGLFIIVVFVILYILINLLTKKRLASYGNPDLIKRLMPDVSPVMKHLKFSILMLSFACFIIALANPQVGASLEKGVRKGVDIMVCLDVSSSMLAEDASPNRLEAAKMAMSRFIDKLQGDRIGLVVFAGKSFVQLPITSDYAAVKMFVSQVNTGMIGEQGTDIASALDLAAFSMLPENANDENVSKISKLTSKVIVVVSDGEDHFNEAAEKAQEINELGIIVHTIGIGSTKGEPIPIRNKNGNIDFRKDSEGNTVITRLNEAALQEIAQYGRGVYVHAGNANMGFDKIIEEIDKMYKSDLEEITFSRYESKFQIPLLFGIFLLVIDTLLFVTKPKWINWLRVNTPSAKIVVLMAFFLSCTMLNAQTKEELRAIRQGNSIFKEAEQQRKDALKLMQDDSQLSQRKAEDKLKTAYENYQKAEIEYHKAMENTKTYDKANYNLANSLYRQEKYEDASKLLDNIINQNNVSDKVKAQALHNLGNSLMKQEKYSESVNAYKNALKLNPSDIDTKYNLEYAKQKMIQQQQQQQNQNQDNKDNKDQQQQQQQQQNQDNKDKKDQQQQQQQKQQNREDQQKKEQQEQQAEKQKKNDDKRQLDALQQNERKTKEKVDQKEMRQVRPVKQEKDW